MILAYGECRGNGNEALRLYRERFPARRQPNSARVIVNAIIRLRANERPMPTKRRGPQNLPVRQEEQVLNHFLNEPGSSTRRAGRIFGINHTAVHQVLKRNRQHPFSVTKVQALKPEDLPRRAAYANWALEKIREDPHFLENIVWTDESLFCRNSMWNRRVVHHWAPKIRNPHVGRELSHQTRWSVNVWAAIRGNDIIGPVFIDGNLNAGRYLEILNGPVSRYMDQLPLAQNVQTWYQHDGAPPHIAIQVRNRLNQIFPNQWIGRFSRDAWPPRSPDLTPLDFFFWGWVKQLVFKTESRTREELVERIVNAFNKIKRRIRQNPALMARVHDNNRRRLHRCSITGGRHIELRRI